MKETLKRLAPTLLGLGVYSVDVMIGRRMLSELDEGSVTYFSYALRLCDFSQGIFIMALSSATLPSLASFVGRGELKEVAQTFAFALRLALFVGVAATVGSVALAEPVVALVFERGQFSAHDTTETARAFMAQGLSIFLVAGVRQLVIVFFALGKTAIPVLVGAFDLVVFFALGSVLREHLGHVGVSLAVTGARVAQFALLWIALQRYLPVMHGREVMSSFARSLSAALIGGAASISVMQLTPAAWLGDSFLRFATTVAAAIVFLLGFGIAAKLLRSEEFGTTIVPLWRRLRKM